MLPLRPSQGYAAELVMFGGVGELISNTAAVVLQCHN
jgi:hypothetical protein